MLTQRCLMKKRSTKKKDARIASFYILLLIYIKGFFGFIFDKSRENLVEHQCDAFKIFAI